MKRFVDSLFQNQAEKIPFTYDDYTVSFFRTEYKSYYMVFFLNHIEDMRRLWMQTSDIYTCLKKTEIYRSEMDKNITCVFCIKVSTDDYENTRSISSISELSKIICMIEEDLEYFAKRVFLYKDNMEDYIVKCNRDFESSCNAFLNAGEFKKYKSNMTDNYQYDLLSNLFITFPFLKADSHFLSNDGKQDYKKIENYVNDKMKEKDVDDKDIQEYIRMIQENAANEQGFFEWLDSLPVPMKNVSVEEK